MEQVELATYLAQLGNRVDTRTGAINLPLYFSTTYQHPGLGESTGYDYTRTKNPTRAVLEEALAVMEEGTAGFATSSGMSAIQIALQIFPQGGAILAGRDLYGGSYRYFADLEKRGFYQFTYAYQEADFLEALNSSTKYTAVYLETPTNPMMQEFDIEKIARAAHQKGAVVIVDNTFYTPYLQRPLTLGADIVVHSATKYLAGHNDILAGALVTNRADLAEEIAYQLNTTGAVLAPFDSWLLIRSLKTFLLRMRQHEANAQKINTYLRSEPRVREVFYPGHGGMLTFKVAEEVRIAEFLRQLKLISFAESLGSVETLITYPETQTHADIPEKLRRSYGLTPDVLRLSVGLEAADDLINDLKHAFLAE